MIRPRIGFVPVARPAFKGDAAGAIRASLASLEALSEALGFELVEGEGAVTDATQAAAAAARLREGGLDYLLIQLTTFATGDVVAPLLSAVARVGLWALPERAGGRGARGPLPLNSLCGVAMALSLLRTPPFDACEPVKWFYGEATERGFQRRLAVTVGALRGVASLRRARVLAIGGTAPGFYGLEETPALPGVTVVRRELRELLERVASVPGPQAEARARGWQEREDSDVTFEQLTRCARIDVALEAMGEEAGASALAVRCWPEVPDSCGSMACTAMGDAGGRGTPAACEGDVMGALSMLALQGVTGQAAILMDVSDVDDADDGLLVWHCGNAPVCWAAPGPAGTADTRLTTHFNRDGMGVVRDMRLRAGPVTGFRLLASGSAGMIMGASVRQPGKAGFDGVRGWLGELSWAGTPVDVRRFVGNLLDRRLPHHVAFGRGDVTAALTELCAFLGAEVLPAMPPSEALRP